ncbi:MAG TPA: hypothetical protein VFQ60_00865 [Patescibacteria group bacterium]|nr:hypothetical protein [Patescibacteria group bacterium]
MAWLFLDTHELSSFRFGWLGEKPVVQKTEARARELLNELPPIEELKQSCKGIVVVAGPGSFSAIRTGVLYANLLSRLLSLPLISVTVPEAEDLMELTRSLPGRTPASYVSPIYEKEPNITKPRPSRFQKQNGS